MSPIHRAALTFICTCVMAATTHAAGPAVNDPAQAGPDFLVQGEYVGTRSAGGDQERIGVQVIAQGSGKFRAVLYPGGLPGDGWNKQPKETAEGATDQGVTTLKATGGAKWNATIDKDTLTLVDPDEISLSKDKGTLTLSAAGGGKLGELKKVDRKSPTLGSAAPPEGITLFDGGNVDAWVNGKMTADKLLAMPATTKQAFTDFRLHLEFRLPFMPEARGQARANSGVYLQRRYECQVLDSFGLEGLDNECGGFYQQKAPDVNMCYPPLSWQTYDFEFTAPRYDGAGKKTANARVTVKHNGVVIHENIELPKETPGEQKEAAGPGPVHLQDHGDPVHYRNVWIVETK